ncbi:MAG: hypothetical protein QM504_14205 [Pseudomonadota bacterium]
MSVPHAFSSNYADYTDIAGIANFAINADKLDGQNSTNFALVTQITTLQNQLNALLTRIQAVENKTQYTTVNRGNNV